MVECKICNKELKDLKGLSVHLSKSHKMTKDELKEYYDKYIKKENEGICYFCENESIFKGITQGYHKICSSKECLGKTRATGTYEFLMYKYNLSKDDAIKLMEKRAKERGKKIKNSLDKKLEENPNFHKEKSHQSKEYWLKRGYTEEESNQKTKEVMGMIHEKTWKKRKEHPELYQDVNTTQIGYWLKKGYSEEESIEKVKNRQSTFTLNKCIKKYGEKEGLKIWKERQEKWALKLKEKLSKLNYKKDYSKIEKQFVEILVNRMNLNMDEHYSCLNEQFFMYNNDNMDYTTYDFVLKKTKKVIEFNGDYWHCKPSKYDKNFFNKSKQMFAHEIWDRDKLRIKYIEKEGYEVKTIWESDYKQNPEKVIKECIEFLKN